jgi:hypothetical protein
MAATCTATDAQYQGLSGTCNDYCLVAGAWPAGTAGAASGNSLACRTTHVGLAAAASGATRTLHCGHAGPSGGNACGSWCENYCYLAQRNCSGANALAFTPDCATACAGLTDGGAAAINAGSGNTVQCRIYHLGAAGASASAATTHCPHGQVVSSTTIGGGANGPCN